MVTVWNPLQSGGGGSTVALAKKHFAAEVIAAFALGSEFYKRTMKETINEGNAKQFDATWRMTEAAHTEGDALGGQNKPQSLARTITLEDKKRTCQMFIDQFKKLMMHNDKISEAGRKSVEALLYKADAWIAQCIILGARQSASGDFDAGNVVTIGVGGDITLDPTDGTAINGTSIANAFPATEKGSKRLQLCLAQLQQKLDEKFVPRDLRTFWVSPYLHRVLRQDNSLLSRDYVMGNASNNKLMATLGLVEGFEIVVTNNMPSTDLSADADTPTAYQGDFSRVAACGIGDAKAVGTLLLGGGIRSLDEVDASLYLADVVGAGWWKGHNWLRPEACCEIRTIGAAP